MVPGEIPPGVGPRWAEIDLDAVAQNTREVKKFVGARIRLMAVVKADGYGLGAEEVAQASLAAGAEALGVTTLPEALGLRKAGIKAPLLVFCPLSPAEAPFALKYQLTVTLTSPAEVPPLAAAARKRGEAVKAHLKVETGMHRLGASREEIEAILALLVSLPEIKLEGVYTHFAAPGEEAFTQKQFDLFQQALNMVTEKGFSVSSRHVCASAATLNYPSLHLDLVRVGTLLYGQFPPGAKRQELNLQDPWRVKARILRLVAVSKRERAGYGNPRAKKSLRLAIVPLGYADGFTVSPVLRPRGWGELFKALGRTFLGYFGYLPRGDLAAGEIRGQRAPLWGRAGMQLSALDVNGIPAVSNGEEVSFSLRRTSAATCLPRVYFQNGQIFKIKMPGGNFLQAEGAFWTEEGFL